MRLRLGALVCLGLLIAGGSRPGDPVRAVDGRLLDTFGRELLLRGVNARVEGLFDVTFDDGRIPLEPIPPFAGEDCRFLSEELGLNFLRLPVNWSAIEPERGRYDEVYIQQVRRLVSACARHGVYTLVDLHQDAWSKEIGEDGAPLWAIVPPPPMLLEGPLTEGELAERRLSPEVGAATVSFFENVHGLQDSYAAMAVHLARRLRGAPRLAGIEVMNEPTPFAGELSIPLVYDFNVRIAQAIRDSVPEMTVFFEPHAIRNLTEAALEVTEEQVDPIFPVSDAVYAPHIYSGVFFGGGTASPERIRADVEGAALDEAPYFATPFLCGEFGNDPRTEVGLEWIRNTLEAFDEVRASWAFWVYEEWSQGRWGLYDSVGGENFPEDQPARSDLRDRVSDLLARPFPEAVDGAVEAIVYDAATRELTVELEQAGRRMHRFSVPRRTYPAGVEVLCDGRPVHPVVASRPGRVSFRCMGTTLVLRPRT